MSIDCFNCLHIWCQIFIIQCEYSSTRDNAPFGRPLRLRNVIELIHYEFERLRLDSKCKYFKKNGLYQTTKLKCYDHSLLANAIIFSFNNSFSSKISLCGNFLSLSSLLFSILNCNDAIFSPSE